MFGVLGVLFGILGVLFGVLCILFGLLGVFFAVLCVFILCFLKTVHFAFSVEKVRRLEKGTPPPVVAVVTIMRYESLLYSELESKIQIAL